LRPAAQRRQQRRPAQRERGAKQPAGHGVRKPVRAQVDLGLQPHENVVPLVREAVLARWGQPLRTALERASARLTTDDLIQLNRAVEVTGLSAEAAAARWWDGE
jgi:hypothetical protein